VKSETIFLGAAIESHGGKIIFYHSRDDKRAQIKQPTGTIKFNKKGCFVQSNPRSFPGFKLLFYPGQNFYQIF
jgi:hypothetical protein